MYNTCTQCLIWLSGKEDNSRESGTGAAHTYNDYPYRWSGAATLSTTLHFLFQDATGAFTSLDDLNETLTDTTQTTLGSLNPGTPLAASPTISVNATLPGGFTLQNTEYEFIHSDGARLAYANASTLSSSTKVPAVGGVKINVYVSGTGASNSNNSGRFYYSDYSTIPSMPVALTLPAAPVLLAPADSAVAVTGTQKVTWTTDPNPGLEYVELATNAGFDLYVYTGTGSIDLARLSKAGLDLPSAQQVYWHVSTDSSVASVDEYAKPGGPTPTAPGAITYGATSPYFSFTTQ